jgi:hypothetical protein
MEEYNKTSPQIIVLTALILVIAGFFSFGLTKKLVDYLGYSRRNVSAQSDPYYVEAYLKYHRGSLALLGKNVSFARLLTTDRLDQEYDQALASATEELTVRAKVFKNLESLSLLDKTGKVLASSEKDDVGQLKKSAGVRAGSDSRDSPLDVCAFVSEEDESFAVMVPVRVAGSLVGVVVGHLGSVDIH